MNKTKKSRKEKTAELERKIKLCNAFLEKTDNKAHYENLIRKYSSEIERNKSRADSLQKFSKAILPAALLVIVIAVLVFLRPAFIGYFALENASSYTQDIDAVFAEDSIYSFYLEQDGELRSLRLNGQLIGDGIAKVYLETDNESYLVFDSNALEEEGLAGITGLIVEDLNETDEEEINETISTSTNETIPSNETIPGNETVEVNETIPGNETIPSDETIENITNPPENAEILIGLEYNDGTEFDSDNDGIEAKGGIVDFNIKNTEFNWAVNKSNLCTRWETYSLDNESSVTICYGNEKCCNFIGLEPLTPSWNEVFYSYYSRYGAGSSNRISSQVVYVDYNINEDDLYSYVYYSDWASLNAVFLEEEEKITYFSDICMETCLLSLDETSYRLRIELENATLRLNNISYTIIPEEAEIINNAPELLMDIPEITISKNRELLIDLSEYFSDKDNDSLEYTIYEMEDISVFVNGSIVTFIPKEGFTGIRNTFIIVNDSKQIAVSNVFVVNVTKAEETPEDIVVENITDIAETPTQLAAEINKPVKWVKKVKAENNETIAKPVNVSFTIPKKAFNLAVKDIKLNKTIEKDKIAIKTKTREDKPKDKSEAEEFEFPDLIEANETKEYIAEYETEAPAVIETYISDYKKQIIISSDTHYVNILAYTDVPVECAPENIRLYWVKNGIRELFTSVGYYDLNNNSLVDRIEWVVPSLSNQTFEVEITVLNVQSYPTVGGKWTVEFTTIGTADLTITAVDGTTYGDSAPDDLEFIELKCGDGIVNASFDGNKIFVPDYECNETGYHTVRVLTEGVHTQEFRFGDAVAYAHNLAGQIPKTLNIQGKLTDSSGSALTGNYNFSFKIYNESTGGTKLWEENQTLAVQDGIYDAILGSSVALTLDFDRQYYLGIQVGTDSEMTPRLNLTSTPYTYRASFAENISIYSTGGLIMDSTGLSLNRSCGNNEILKWDGSAWNCAADSGVGSEADTLDTVSDRGAATDKALTIDSDGNETTVIGGDLQVQGNITGSSPVKIKGGLNVLNESGDTQLYVNETTGYIGVGTASPTQKLHVAGDLNVTGEIYGDQSANNYVYNGTDWIPMISDADGVQKVVFNNSEQGYWSVSGNYYYYNDGNVGIGTASPADKLTVVGTLNVTDIQLSTNCADGEILKWSGGVGTCGADSGVGSEADTLATVTARGNTTTQNLTIGDKLTFAFSEFIDNLVDGWLRVTGSLNITQNLKVGGDANITGDLKVDGNITGGSPVKIKGGLNVLNSSGTSQLYVNDTTGNVGIGTTNPGSTLEINGTFHVKTKTTFSATGGTITTSGGYTIHTFTENGTFTPNVAGTVEVLVVAGGGAGGGWVGAGGGAGGFRTNASFAVTAQTYGVTIGAGGTGVTDDRGNDGASSIFSTITSAGGGGGGSHPTNTAGNAGGSGGGAGSTSQTYGAGNTPSTDPSQGNNGGKGYAAQADGGGGGGGASAVGADAASLTGGNGGAGSSSTIYDGSTIYYAGGGGGGGTNTQGSGGTGGGGAGGSTSATAGTANTGGGGGGCRNTVGVGGAGGSGIVIIRYPTLVDSIVVNSTTGNVGIGTTSPTSTLHVVGEASISGIAGDGTNKCVCIKSDGTLGTCTCSSCTCT